MITLKEACQIDSKKEPQASFFDAFEYKDMYVFHMFDGEVWTEGNTMDYYMSVNKNNGECNVFSYWDEVFDNPDDFVPASKKRISPEHFLN